MRFRGEGGRGGGIREERRRGGGSCTIGLGGDAPGGGLVCILQGGMGGPGDSDFPVSLPPNGRHPVTFFAKG